MNATLTLSEAAKRPSRRALLLLSALALLAGCDLRAKAAAEAKHAEMERTMLELDMRISRLEAENRLLRDELDAIRRGGAASTAAAPVNGRCSGGGSRYTLRIAELDAAMGNVSALAQEARIVPKFENGVARGFKVFAIRPDSLSASCGLQNGDVVRAINGMDLSTPDKALDAYAKIKDATLVELSIERGGASMTLTIDIER